MKWIDRYGVVVSIVISLIFCSSLLLIGEFYLRFKNTPSLYKPDSEIGWVANKNYHGSFKIRRLDHSEYNAEVKTDEQGLRRNLIQPNSSTFTVLVLGDSYTMDPSAGNKDMWWSVAATAIERELALPSNSLHVLAGGGGGYGTLQNLLLLKRLNSQGLVRPDLFILQFCSNDFVNNHREWESTTKVRNQKYARPYFELDHTISFSKELLAPIWRNHFFQNSRLFGYLDIKLQGIFYRILSGYGPSYSHERTATLEKEALELTSLLLMQLRKEIGETPSIAVNCDASADGLNAKWTELVSEAGFIPIEQPAKMLLERRKSSNEALLFNIDGGHFSDHGNVLFGETLAHSLIKLDLLKLHTQN